jgi:hypothetical protein
MPRESAEAAAAAYMLAGGRHPEPPAAMPGEASRLWREIVEARPPDFFKPGQLHLLAIFVRLLAVHERLLEDLEADPTDETIKRAARLASSITTYATKLRLTVQSASRVGEGKLEEPQAKPSGLLGGHAIETR